MPTSIKCPHCGKPLEIYIGTIEWRIGKPSEPKQTMQKKLPDQTIDEALAGDNELLDVAPGDGVIIYALKEWQEDKTVWRRINAIMTQYGGKWIAAGKESRWEVPT